MHYCNEESLGDLKVLVEEKKVFDKEIKENTFFLILELLKNVTRGKNKKLLKCLPKKLIIKLRKQKKTIQYLLKKRIKSEKKKKFFFDSKKSFKKAITLLIKVFLERCTEFC